MAYDVAMKPGASPGQAQGGEPPVPGKNPLLENTYLRRGALCENPTVGDCSLDPETRGRLVHLYQDRVRNQHDAFRMGGAMAYTDIKLDPDMDTSWWIKLGLDAAAGALGSAVGKALDNFGKWAKGARNEAYEALFAGEFVSERSLKLYGRVAQLPMGPLKWVSKGAFSLAAKDVPKLEAGPSAQEAAEFMLRVMLRQANIAYDAMVNAPGTLDDAQLLAMYESMDPVTAPDATEYRDQIMAKVGEMRSEGIDKIGKRWDPGNAGGVKHERGAVWVTDGLRRRLMLVEHDSPRYLLTKGDALRKVEDARNKFISWIDDPTMQEAAIQLTEARGDGHVGTLDVNACEAHVEDFQW